MIVHNEGFQLDNDGPSAPILQDSLICLNADYVAIAQKNFSVDILPVKAPNRPVAVTLSDRVSKWGAMPSCVSFIAGDKQRYDVELIGGTPTTCPVADHLSVYKGNPSGLVPDDIPHTISAGPVNYTVSARKSGTPVLSVAAFQGEQLLWNTPLRLAAFGTIEKLTLVATPWMVVTWGALLSDDDVGVIVGLNPQSGVVQYEVSQESTWSGNNTAFVFNGRYLIAHWGCGLHAYDPASGKRVWHIGGR